VFRAAEGNVGPGGIAEINQRLSQIDDGANFPDWRRRTAQDLRGLAQVLHRTVV
jgi:hypothetical protein